MSPSQLFRKTAKRLLPESLHPVMFSLRRQWSRSRKRQQELGQYATAVLTETRHGRLLVPAADMEVGRHLAHAGDYGLAEVDYHLGYLTPASRVLVVGAHVGALLIPLAKHVSKVIGVEANPDTFRLLELNVLLNGLNNVQLHNIAAGDRNGEVEFLMRRCNTGASAIVSGDLAAGKAWTRFDEPKTARVPQRKLDDLLTEHAFDLIIMDVEGAEYPALKGMSQILGDSRRLQIEVIPYLTKTRSGASGTQFTEFLANHFPLGKPFASDTREMALRPTAQVVSEVLAQNRRGYDLFLEKEL